MNKIGSTVVRLLKPVNIPRVHKYIIITQTLFFIMVLNKEMGFLNMVAFSRDLVLEGEVWRCVSWYFVPFLNSTPFWFVVSNVGVDVLLVFISLYILYYFGGIIEGQLGTRVNTVFYFLAWLLPTCFSFFSSSAYMFQNSYLALFIVLIYTRLFPEATIYFAFVLPIKCRIIEIISWAFFFMGFYQQLYMSLGFLATYLILFGFPFTRLNIHVTKKKRKPNEATLHQCAICKTTERKNPEIEFRVCAKCDQELCENHLGKELHECSATTVS